MLEHFGKVLIGAELAIDIWRLIKNPEQRDHWVYYILQDVADMVAGYLIGCVRAVILAAVCAEALPALLIAIIGLFLGGIGAWTFEHFFNPWASKISEGFVDNRFQFRVDGFYDDIKRYV
jgi:hypothetical protein